MFGDGSLTLREFLMREPTPLATIQDAVLGFLRDHAADAALSGCQAVNAYVDEPRMTQDVDILSSRAGELAAELCRHLKAQFHIAVRIREIGDGRAYQVFQIQKPRNRHLADIRAVGELPPTQDVQGVRVVTPAELVASKVMAYHRRKGAPKSYTDQRDLAVLLLRFPGLKTSTGAVRDRLVAENASEGALATWRELVAQEIKPETEEGEF